MLLTLVVLLVLDAGNAPVSALTKPRLQMGSAADRHAPQTRVPHNSRSSSFMSLSKYLWLQQAPETASVTGPVLAHLNADGHVSVLEKSLQNRSKHQVDFHGSMPLRLNETPEPAEPASGGSKTYTPWEDFVSSTSQTAWELLGSRTEPVEPSLKGPILKHERKPLPHVLQVAMAVVVMMVVAGFLTFVRIRLTAVIPRNADSQRLDVVLQETMEKVDELSVKLEERFDLLDAEARGDPQEREEREKIKNQRRKEDERSKEILEAAEKIADQRENLIQRAADIKKNFSEAVDSTRVNMEDFTRVESSALYNKVQEAATEKRIPAWEPPDWISADEDDADFFTIPPIMQLFAGTVSPSRLRFLRYTNSVLVSASMILIGIAIFVILDDRNTHCKDRFVWIWMYGITACTIIDFVCRSILVSWCRIEMRALRAMREELDRANASTTGIPWLDFLAQVRRGGLSFFEAFFRYRSIVESYLYGFIQTLSFLTFLWGAFGVYISIADIIIDTLACDSKVVLSFQHAYSMFYVVMLTWNILGCILSITNEISNSSVVSTFLMKSAKSMDDELSYGLPVWLTLVQSFVLKNSSDALGLSERQVRDEIRKLNERMREIDDVFRLRRRTMEYLKERQNQSETEQQFLARCQRNTDLAMEQLRPIVGLIAANVRTSPHDPTSNSAQENLSNELGGLRVHIGGSPYNARLSSIEEHEAAEAAQVPAASFHGAGSSSAGSIRRSAAQDERGREHETHEETEPLRDFDGNFDT